MATNCISGAARQATNPAHSQLSSPSRGSDGGGGGGDRDPSPSQRTPMLNSQLCPQDLLFRLASTMRVAQSPHLAGKVERQGWELCLKKKKKQQKNKTKQKVPRTSSPADAILPPAAHSPRAGRALAPSTAPSPRGARRAPQGTYLALAFECAGRRGFHLGFQISFREEGGKKKNPIMQMDSGRGRRALNLTLLLYEFLEQPRPGRFMGARHGYARSRRRSISKLIKAVMSTFLATLRAWVYYFTLQHDPGGDTDVPPTPLFFLSSSPSSASLFLSLLFPLFKSPALHSVNNEQRCE